MAIYEEKQKKKYEIDGDEDGSVLACFVETCSMVYKDGVELSRSHHRDVIGLDEVKKVVEKLEDKIPEAVVI